MKPTARIRYTSTGPVYFLGDREVTKDEFEGRLPSKLEPMLESGRVPCIQTDSTYMAGYCNGNQFEGEEKVGDYYRQVAEEHGQSTTGKRYLHQLAKFPGDPEAWVSGRGDIKRVVEDRGWYADGVVSNKGIEVEPAADLKLCPSIVKREADKLQAMDPGLKREDAEGKVLDTHAPKW